MGLAKYKEKRDFEKTAEPAGTRSKAKHDRAFVIQKHAASRLHYDLRLEIDGVFKSWAVPKGPSLDPGMKRLAVQVEDHPIDYGDFEGVIPKGEYGGGEVIIWDRGKLEIENPRNELKNGVLKIKLNGKKLKGGWSLVRINNDSSAKNWLLIKEKDEFANPDIDIVKAKPLSVVSGRRVEQLRGRNA